MIAASVVALSFGMFVIDELGEGSETQVRSIGPDRAPVRSDAVINEPAPTPRVERDRESRHSSVREFIDDGNDIFLSPFTGLVQSDQVWVQRLVPTTLALLLFGLGGLLLANLLPQPSRKVQDWREAPS